MCIYIYLFIPNLSYMFAALLVGRARDRFLVVSLDFSVTCSFRPYHGPGVDLAPSENEHQEHFLGVQGAGAWRLTTSSPSCAECHEIWEPKPPGTLWATNRACYGTPPPTSHGVLYTILGKNFVSLFKTVSFIQGCYITVLLIIKYTIFN